MKHDGLGVVEYCVKHGYCATLDPNPKAWYELRVACSRLFHESYQELEPAFNVLLAICAQMHANGKVKVKVKAK